MKPAGKENCEPEFAIRISSSRGSALLRESRLLLEFQPSLFRWIKWKVDRQTLAGNVTV